MINVAISDSMKEILDSTYQDLGLDQESENWVYNTYAEVLLRMAAISDMGYKEISVHAAPSEHYIDDPTWMCVTYPQEWTGMEYLLEVVATLLTHSCNCCSVHSAGGRMIFWDALEEDGTRTPFIALGWKQSIDEQNTTLLGF